jgi:hypothetical protein
MKRPINSTKNIIEDRSWRIVNADFSGQFRVEAEYSNEPYAGYPQTDKRDPHIDFSSGDNLKRLMGHHFI